MTRKATETGRVSIFKDLHKVIEREAETQGKKTYSNLARIGRLNGRR